MQKRKNCAIMSHIRKIRSMERRGKYTLKKFLNNTINAVKKHKVRYIVLGVIFVAAVVLLVIGINQNKKKNRTYVSYDVEMSKELSGSQTDGIYSMKEGVFLYSRDGAKVIDPEGTVVWDVSYNMSNPIAAVSGSCAAVADMDGKKLYIFDGTGSANPVETEYPIRKISVANQGVTAVLMDDGTCDYIIIYDISGNVLVEMNTIISASGFPVDIALSPDGTKLVTSYVNFEEEELFTQLTFYNFGEVGANYVDGLVGLEKFSDSLVGDVVFAENDVIIAFSDTGFVLYNMKEVQEKVTAVTISETIVSVAHSDGYVGVVTDSREEGGNYGAYIYNFKGEIVDTKHFTERYDHFQIDGSDVLLYDDLQIYIYRIGGKDKFSATVAKNVNYIYSVDGQNQFILVGDSVLERIRLIGDKE